MADIYPEKGKAEGKVAGKLEGIKQVAENLLMKGSSVEYVVDVTGLDEKEVEKIKQ